MRSGSAECHERPAWAQHAVKLGKCRRNVGHVLEDLHGQRAVEACVIQGEGGHVAGVEAAVGVTLATPGGELQHLWAGVHSGHGALGPDPLEGFGHVEARPAAGVQDSLAGASAQRLVHDRAAAKQIALRVCGLELLGEPLVELDLAQAGSAAGSADRVDHLKLN
jgi:hypothetical protein